MKRRNEGEKDEEDNGETREMMMRQRKMGKSMIKKEHVIYML